MKNEDKKVPDAPKRLWVFPCHTGLTCGLLDPDGKQHGGYPVWQGMANRMSADDELYINISKVWHKGKELPKSNEEDCLLDYADGLTIEVGHTYTDPDGTRGWLTDSGDHLFEEIVQWAYIRDIVPALVNYKKEAQNEKDNVQ